jgi:hypothetical protein
MLHVVSPLGGFVVVAQDWPGSVILVLALNLHPLAGYFPIKFHRYFNLPKNVATRWHSMRDFSAPYQDQTIVYLLSGDSVFLQHILDTLAGCQRVFVTVEFTCCLASRPKIHHAVKASKQLLADFGLCSLMVGVSAVGGATAGWHLLSFGSDLGSTITPTAEPGLPRMLHHFLDGGVDGRFPSVLKSSIPELVTPAWAVLLHNGIVRPEGLFPWHLPGIQVYAPFHIHQD